MKLPLSRRHFVALAAAALTCTAQAADPITIIVPYPPGGLSDTLARLTGKVMDRTWACP